MDTGIKIKIRTRMMNHPFKRWAFMLTLIVFSIAGCGSTDGGTAGSGGAAGSGGMGGDGGAGGASRLAPELFGTWDLVSVEVADQSTTCPGVADGGDLSCPTASTTFNSDGTFVGIESTDEFGAPFNDRTEGTWSTRGSTLNVISRQEGPDENNLQPIEPPEEEALMWSVDGPILSLTTTDPGPPLIEFVLTLEKR
jgi:hypothetical protein